jgi:hypothetical protein
MLDSWRFKNFRQPEDGPRLCCEFIYFATVLAETAKPSLASSEPIFCGHLSDERLKFLGNRATTTPLPLPT